MKKAQSSSNVVQDLEMGNRNSSSFSEEENSSSVDLSQIEEEVKLSEIDEE